MCRFPGALIQATDQSLSEFSIITQRSPETVKVTFLGLWYWRFESSGLSGCQIRLPGSFPQLPFPRSLFACKHFLKNIVIARKKERTNNESTTIECCVDLVFLSWNWLTTLPGSSYRYTCMHHATSDEIHDGIMVLSSLSPVQISDNSDRLISSSCSIMALYWISIHKHVRVISL